MLTRISPALAVANWVTTHSALFGDQIPIRSPRLRPSAKRPLAKASTLCFSSRQLQRICWWRTIKASRSAYRSAIWSKYPPIVAPISGAWFGP